jgi:hypothetical protein
METKLLKIVRGYVRFMDYEHIWIGRRNIAGNPIVTWQGKDHEVTYVLDMMNIDIRPNHEEPEHSGPDDTSDH